MNTIYLTVVRHLLSRGLISRNGYQMHCKQQHQHGVGFLTLLCHT